MYRNAVQKEEGQVASPGENGGDAGQAMEAKRNGGAQGDGSLPVAAQSLEGEDKKSMLDKERTKTSSALQQALNTSQGKTFTTAVVTGLVVALLFFLAITPAVSSITKQLEVNSALKDRIAQMDAKLDILLQLTSKEQTNQADLEIFNSILSTAKHQGNIYSELSSLVSRNGMTFKSINFDPDKVSDPKYNDLSLSFKTRIQSVRLSATGTPEEAQGLIADIEGTKRIYDIRDIVITVPENGEETKEVQVELNMNTFYWEKS